MNAERDDERGWIQLTRGVRIPRAEIDIQAMRSQGAGGQNVNKVATAIHLRFDIRASSIPERYKAALLSNNDSRITRDGVLVIKSQRHRSQEMNRAEAIERLRAVVRAAGVVRAERRPTRPTRGSVQRRLDTKSKRAKLKSARRRDYRDD